MWLAHKNQLDSLWKGSLMCTLNSSAAGEDGRETAETLVQNGEVTAEQLHVEKCHSLGFSCSTLKHPFGFEFLRN